MPDAYTPQLALIQPEVGASRDTWGAKWNDNATIIDQFVSQFCQIGIIADFAGPTAPSGWLICDGRTISRTTYAKLFAVIGTYWGAGDGSTTFRLPNTAGRSLLGPGTVTDQGGLTYGFSFTQAQGYVYSPIMQLNLPNYTLTTDTRGNHTHVAGMSGEGSHAHVVDAAGDHQHGIAVPYSTPNFTSIFPVWNTASGSIYSATDPAGAHTHSMQPAGFHTHSITVYATGDHAHSVSLGGGGVPMTVLNPFLTVTKIIYAGQEAAIVTAADVPTAPGSTDLHREIESLREEITALRALFETPRARMLSAPNRGPH
jgi:microcystin-dependent protein